MLLQRNVFVCIWYRFFVVFLGWAGVGVGGGAWALPSTTPSPKYFAYVYRACGLSRNVFTRFAYRYEASFTGLGPAIRLRLSSRRRMPSARFILGRNVSMYSRIPGQVENGVMCATEQLM